MSSRSLSEFLLRPTSLARTPFCQTLCIRRTAPSYLARRAIHNTPSAPAAQPQRKDDDNYEAPPQEPLAPRHLSSASTHRRSTSQKDTSEFMDSLFPGGTNQRSASTQTQPSSGDEIRAARQNRVFGAGFSDPQFKRKSRPPSLNFDEMLPSEVLDPNLSNKPSDAASLATQQEETFSNYPRLNPTYGRTVELDASRGRDIVRGIGMLGSLMARNKIRHDMNKQRFHERGGLKRKRLHSERWRARFKIGFRDVTARVSELTRKGW